MSKIGLLRVLSTDDEELLNRHGRLLQDFISDPELNVVSHCIEGHPQGLWSSEEEQKAIPKIVRLGQDMAHRDGVAAILISCVADPGVSELRAAVNIPVIGAGAASAATAWALGRPVGALGITPAIPLSIAHALGNRLVGWQIPEGVKTTVDLMSDRSKSRFVEAADRLIRDGAEAILLACTGFSTIHIAPFLEEALGLPVIDPVISSGLMAYYVGVGKRRSATWRH